MTQYERKQYYKKTTETIGEESQYQFGTCGLNLSSLKPKEGDEDTIVCTPSGYLYDKAAILEYMITKSQERREQQRAYDEAQATEAQAEQAASLQKRQAAFEDSQRLVKKTKTEEEIQKEKQVAGMKHASYWLAESQPEAVQARVERPSSETRPPSPHSREPLRRKDLWPLHLEWKHDQVVCAVSEKPITTNNTTVATWTDKKKAGVVMLEQVYKDMVQKERMCPITSRPIKYTRRLVSSGGTRSGTKQNKV